MKVMPRSMAERIRRMAKASSPVCRCAARPSRSPRPPPRSCRACGRSSLPRRVWCGRGQIGASSPNAVGPQAAVAAHDCQARQELPAIHGPLLLPPPPFCLLPFPPSCPPAESIIVGPKTKPPGTLRHRAFRLRAASPALTSAALQSTFKNNFTPQSPVSGIPARRGAGQAAGRSASGRGSTRSCHCPPA